MFQLVDYLDVKWRESLHQEIFCSEFTFLEAFLLKEYETGKVFPPFTEIFSALNSCPPQKVKVVILGQDPYHGDGEANGLAFSVHKGIKIPPSLRNIFEALKRDLNVENGKHGDLSSWAKQGVLLLNSCLTVKKDLPASHQNKGWEQFTDGIIRFLNGQDQPIVFMLWGNFARSKEKMIDNPKHLVLSTTHPSPFSAHKGFLESRHFSRANTFLKKNNLTPVDWNLD